ncbi:SocA family protein [Bacteroides sp. 14(A)]|uniref:SocA family protein n=1 Tax=Bacteroides sp. 14(A) TaxID=1163670 RepID=UPI001E5F5913|nr:SocA family protein [Bacteroides sp. 14(A)]
MFLTAAPKREGASDLLDVFNNFHALPYGPVESDIYNAIQDKRLPSYIVTERSVVKKENAILPYKIEDYTRIKDAVDTLKEKNKYLILLNAFLWWRLHINGKVGDNP